ncbi:DUF3500 domain-containing protein [Dactylosporangium sp. CS-033363]|uniref:DUF3500 domain-containing protein n=1 Tax=Dactylosporangium sp. CS-033363 TaxID=3239935 RepID=UPI003D8E9BF1
MRSCFVAGLVLAAATAACGPADSGLTPPPVPSCAPAPASSAVSGDVLEATKSLLGTLDDDQAARARDGGLPLTDLSDVQRAAVLAVLKAGLSDGGYQQIAKSTAADGIDRYRVGLDGTPESGGTWVVRFTGPRLSVHLAVAGGAISAVCGASPTPPPSSAGAPSHGATSARRSG